jgi:hypothetical protein
VTISIGERSDTPPGGAAVDARASNGAPEAHSQF